MALRVPPAWRVVGRLSARRPVSDDPLRTARRSPLTSARDLHEHLLDAVLDADITVAEMYLFITGDFEDGWESLASNPAANSRNNFAFALKACILLEWAARLCQSDPAVYADLTSELERVDKRYFAVIPGAEACLNAKKLLLPAVAGVPAKSQVLWLLFDLIRNGEAHQYQQISETLSDGAKFIVALTGAEHGRTLGFVRANLAQLRIVQHLDFWCDSAGTWALMVNPEILSLDIRAAIDAARLVTRVVGFNHLGPRQYTISGAGLEAALVAGGLKRFPVAGAMTSRGPATANHPVIK